MIIVDSPFHITFSEDNKNPKYVCIEKCKSIFWPSDIDKIEMICNKCGGKVEKSTEGIHYKIIKRRSGRLKINDFIKQFPGLPKNEKESLKSYLGNGAKIGLLSMVKPEFIEKAKKEWC